ncbi:uncharacterized protein LOC136755224 [Amia ocellicauda]|uniref:uncharacterized protein LOC136755224 n=1 Tax=Amia ocellicauda TaxID=2972642 RepID=UPI00346388EB
MSKQVSQCSPCGGLLCWGCGEMGQTGHGRVSNVIAKQSFLEELDVRKFGKVQMFACGSSHCIVVTEHNRIFTWGNGTSGQLGSGEKTVEDRPREVFLPFRDEDGVGCDEIAGVSCGSRHTFIWTKSGDAFSFGNNFYAQLGYDFRKENFKEHQSHQGGRAEGAAGFSLIL